MTQCPNSVHERWCARVTSLCPSFVTDVSLSFNFVRRPETGRRVKRQDTPENKPFLELFPKDSWRMFYAGELEVPPTRCTHHSFAQAVAFVSARAPRSGLRPTSVVLLNASMLETSRVEMTVSILRCRRHN